MPLYSDIQKAATFSRARWVILGCVLLLFALVFVIWGLSLGKLTWDQQRLLVWVLPLASGFSAAAFAGSIITQARKWIPGLVITATGGVAVWLITYFFLFPESKVTHVAPIQQNSPTATYQPPDSITRQQRDDAQETLRIADERFAAGTGTLSELISAHRQLIKVELNSCRTPVERIAVLTAALDMAQELESGVNFRLEAGTVPSIDLPQVRQYRLETEIELAKSKQEASVQHATYQPPESITRQQRDDAQATFDSATERFWAGTGTLSELISAHQQLIKVELDSCRTPHDRIAVVATALKTLQELESHVNAAYNDGKLPFIDITQTRQYRLETEIELAKLRSINSPQTLWENLRIFMRWDAFPKDYKALLDACVVNVAAAGAIYFLSVLALYGIAPARFVAWHEWIANAGIPFSEKIAKTLAPFLLDTSHTLSAVVLRYQKRALKLFNDTQEAKDRLKWVPAPLQIDDEPLYDYKRPQTLPSQKPYVAGLLELQTRLGVGSKHFGKQRSIVSIEGPGGVGKSALAFQIARWASDSRADYQLVRFPILPVLLRSLGNDASNLHNVDEAAADSLRLIMETSKISAPLLQALLRRKRVLVVVDGVSELPKEAADLPIRPDKGAVDTRFFVVTSRLPTNLPESLLIRPQGLTIEVLDRVLDDVIAANVGSRRFNDADREALRTRIRSLIKVAGEGAKERQVPMIFIKLMIERADRLLNEGKQLAELPTTLAELVTEYTEQLLRNEQDLPLVMHQARTTAQVCMGKGRSPAARSQNRYMATGVSKEILDKFVTAGLMVRSGEKGDPFYKFALDPIAEQLDASRLVIGIRDDSADQTEIDDLIQQWEKVPEDFIRALRRAAAEYRHVVCRSQGILSSKLWPEKIKATGPIGIGTVAQSGPPISPQSPMSDHLSALRHDLAVICKAALVVPDFLGEIRRQPWKSILRDIDGAGLMSKIFDSALEPGEPASLAAFFASLSKSDAAVLSLLLANNELNERMGYLFWTQLAAAEFQRRKRRIENNLRLAGEDVGAQRQANEELKEVLDLESRFTDSQSHSAAQRASSQAALQWENHLGHVYQSEGTAIYTQAVRLTARNISGRPVRLEHVRLISGITGAIAEVEVGTEDGRWVHPSNIDPIPANRPVTLQAKFAPPTGLAAQEFINSWGTMQLSVTYDGATHEIPIRGDMTRALYDSFRPSPLERG